MQSSCVMQQAHCACGTVMLLVVLLIALKHALL
jgi:hypothetical protein